MKIRPLILTGVLALMLGLAFAATVTQNASAKCYDPKTKAEIPCPSREKVKKPTPTDVPPTETPAPTATPVPAPSATPVAAIVLPSPPAASADSAACRTSPLGGLLAGLGLLAAGIILRAAPGASEGSSDGFEYAHSQGQARMLGTAFGERSARTNDRLPDADPVSGPGGASGKSLARVARLARLLSLPGMVIGGLLTVVAAGQYGGVLGCTPWPVPGGDGGIAATGIGLGLAIASVALALIIAAWLRYWSKYTMFSPEGVPTRATVHVAMKQASGGSGKTDSGSSSDDDSDGDDH